MNSPKVYDASGREIVEPYPEGARVHHRGGVYSKGAPGSTPGHAGPYWGTVVRSVEQGDGTYEYEVLPDTNFASTHLVPQLTWWGSHHIDEAHPVIEQREKES